MERRDFIKRTAAVTSAALLTNHKLFAMGDEIIGQNERKYRLDKNWVKSTGSGLPVNDCHEMIQDNNKRIVLLTNETKNNVIFFNKDGTVVKTWGHDFPGAHGLTLFGEGKDQLLFITDTERHQFYKTTIDGKLISTWDFPIETEKYTEAKQFVPTETAITKNGEVYVADGYGSQYIIHYDAQGKIKNIFGGKGEKESNLDNAHGICIDYRQNPETLIITDRTRCCFKRFSMAGEYLETISLPGACVCRPVIKGNYLYAAVLRSPNLDNVDSGFVIILNKENKPISVLGGSEASYDSNGKLNPFQQTQKLFQHPHDVLVDDDENLYVCQWASGKVYPYRLRRVS
jgi:peptidylamidoglycolate lyase